MSVDASSCPLCAATDNSIVETIPFERIWSALAEQLQARFSSDVVARHTPSRDTHLVACRGCGLLYFAPAVAGDAAFYEELKSTVSDYYKPHRWDLAEAAARIPAGARALDIGCGSGGFLRMLVEKGVAAVGIDTNTLAVKDAQRAGLPAECVDIATYARLNPERFDAVTALHVVEHLSDIPSFVRPAVSCLKPGGRLIVALPNRLRRISMGFEPLDCPPHHISRWASPQFGQLAALCGCRVLEVREELASMHECRRLVRRWLSRSGDNTESWPLRIVARAVCGTTLYEAYRRLGWLDRWNAWGHSLLCVLEREH